MEPVFMLEEAFFKALGERGVSMSPPMRNLLIKALNIRRINDKYRECFEKRSNQDYVAAFLKSCTNLAIVIAENSTKDNRKYVTKEDIRIALKSSQEKWLPDCPFWPCPANTYINL